MKNILLITDKKGPEAEVSQKSCDFVFSELKKRGHNVKIIFWDYEIGISRKDLDAIDIAIPVVHGIPGEDGQITKFLKKRGIKTLFSDEKVHKLCINKHKTKDFLKSLEFAVPWSLLVSEINQKIEIPRNVKKIFVKPNNGGSSIDSGIFATITEAKLLIDKILKYDEVIVEEYIEKPREFTVAISGNYHENIEVLGIMEIVTQRDFFDYKAKYERLGTKEIFPELDSVFRAYIEKISLQIYKKLNIKTFARIDYLYKDNVLYFLEINTIPGMTAKSFFPQCVEHAGYLSFGEFLEQFLEQFL